MLFKLAVQVTKLVVRTIKWAEWYQLNRIGRQIRCVLLVSCYGGAVLDLVGGTMEFGNDSPWARGRVSKLVNLTLCCIQTNSLTRKDNVADRIDLRIGSTQVDEFAVVSTLLLNQQTSIFSES
jgi:hypothetical protein